MHALTNFTSYSLTEVTKLHTFLFYTQITLFPCLFYNSAFTAELFNGKFYGLLQTVGMETQGNSSHLISG